MSSLQEGLSSEEIKGRANDLAHRETTMTVATAQGNTPWAAPVYYVYRSAHFYFFSDPCSRHIVESQVTGRSAASVHATANSWKDIRGLQMSGCIRQVSLGSEAARAVTAYLRKFPFTREFFSSGMPLTMEAFQQRFKVRMYAFIPELVYYLDNRIRFGFREKIDM